MARTTLAVKQAATKVSKVKKALKKSTKGAVISAHSLAALVLQRPAQGESTKALNADLNKLQPHLGRKCPHFGKKGVLQIAAPAGKSKQGKGKCELNAPPRFNKYAGWAEWNNSIFLWVNAAGGNFVNTFKSGGQKVTWYVGGANPTLTSPIVGRLLRTSKGQAPDANTRVLLFVRELATEPYMYCGGLSYLSHDPSKKGFEFTWRLQDHARLQKTEGFKTLLKAARGDGPKASKTARTASRWA